MRTALVFPGQGSQRAGMLDNVPELESLDRLLDAAEALTGRDLRRVAAEGSPEELADTRVAQPLLYLTDWAWGFTLLESGLDVDVVAGHSLGEFAALAIAGVFSVEAGLELVCERGALMASAAAATPGGMSAVLGLDAETIRAVLRDFDGVWVANDNAPGQVVISGQLQAVHAASEALTAAGARRVVALDVAGAFHSPLMEPAQEAFADILSQTSFRNAQIPVIQNTCPEPMNDAHSIRERLLTQITSPVRWTETMLRIAADGPTRLIEAGPGSVLAGLAKRVEGLSAVSVETTELERIVEGVS